jgi:hypothetical protein
MVVERYKIRRALAELFAYVVPENHIDLEADARSEVFIPVCTARMASPPRPSTPPALARGPAVH